MSMEPSEAVQVAAGALGKVGPSSMSEVALLTDDAVERSSCSSGQRNLPAEAGLVDLVWKVRGETRRYAAASSRVSSGELGTGRLFE